MRLDRFDDAVLKVDTIVAGNCYPANTHPQALVTPRTQCLKKTTWEILHYDDTLVLSNAIEL